MDSPSTARAVAVPPALAVDPLSVGIISLVGLTIVQRLVGFARGVILGRVLDPVELGRWDLAFGFLILVAPLVVLGIPGSLGRYFDSCRARGELQTLLGLTLRVCLLAVVVGGALIVVFRSAVSAALFGVQGREEVVVYLAASLVTVVAGNTVVSLTLAARMYRATSRLQLVHGLGFAVFSVALALAWRPAVESAIAGYALASALVVLLAAPVLRGMWRSGAAVSVAPASSEPPFWRRLLPFAASMWLANLLTNVFDLTDRVLIVHASQSPPDAVLAQVGAYHAARLLPLVLVGLATLLGAALTPAMSRDWEAGRRDAAVNRLNTFVKGLLLASFAGAVVVLLITPLLFGVALGNKFPEGPSLVPLMAAYGVWFGAIPAAQNYLWCLERARLGNVALVAGIALNVALSLMLLPRFGVYGVALATSIANLMALSLVLLFSARLGMRWHRGVWILVAIPVTLWGGPWIAAASLLLICALALRTELLFTLHERQQAVASISQLRASMTTRWR